MKQGIKKHTIRIILLALILAVGGFLAWGFSPMQPEETVLACSNEQAVRCTQENGWLIFSPAGEPPQTGLIFYPGGHVDWQVYNRPLRQIAEAGYLVVVVRMPLSLAVLGANRAEAVMAAFPDVENWAVGGHSLGGAMAATFASRHPDQVKGLVLWAAYPPDSADLSAASGLKAAVIYGTEDGLATPEEVLGAKAQLPPSTVFTAIEGGNHSQFGNYGHQSGDGEAQIPVEAQQALVISATLALLESLEDRNTN